MCEPIDPLLIEKRGSVLLNKLVLELHQAWGEIITEPRFAENPVGSKLCDIVHNADHASEHMHTAMHIISIMQAGGFINEFGLDEDEQSPTDEELEEQRKEVEYEETVKEMNANFCEIDPANDNPADDYPERDLSGEWGDE